MTPDTLNVSKPCNVWADGVNSVFLKARSYGIAEDPPGFAAMSSADRLAALRSGPAGKVYRTIAERAVARGLGTFAEAKQEGR